MLCVCWLSCCFVHLLYLCENTAHDLCGGREGVDGLWGEGAGGYTFHSLLWSPSMNLLMGIVCSNQPDSYLQKEGGAIVLKAAVSTAYTQN